MDKFLVPVYAAALFGAGIALFIKPSWLLEFWLGKRILDAPKWDCLHPLLRERLRAALERRRMKTPYWPSYACGAVQIIVAGAALALHFSVAMLFAVWAIATAPLLALALMLARPASTHRVASLRPRNPFGNAALIVSTAAVAAISVIAFVTGTREGIMMGIAAAVCGISAMALACAPAILTGEDLAAEQYVDKMVRSVQTLSINLVGTIAALLLTTSHTAPEWAKESAFAAYFVGFFAFYLAYRIPNERERWEMVQ